MKANSVKQEFEKQDELKRSALRGTVALLNVPDSSKFIQIKFYWLYYSQQTVVQLTQIVGSFTQIVGSFSHARDAK